MDPLPSAISIIGVVFLLFWIIRRVDTKPLPGDVAEPLPELGRQPPKSQSPTHSFVQMPTASPTSTLPLAVRGARLGAAFVDLIASLGAFLPGLLMMGVATSGYGTNDAQMGFAMLLFAAGFFGLLVYQIYLLVTRGQTIGKRALTIRIVDYETEEIPTWGRLLFVRQMLPGIIGSIPYVGWIFLLTDPLFIFRDDRRCLHDLMAGTKVVEGQPEDASVASQARSDSATQQGASSTIAGSSEPGLSQQATAEEVSRTSTVARQRTDDVPDEDLETFVHRLQKLHGLHQNGVLTGEEYRRAKRTALAEMVGETEAHAEDVLLMMQRLRTEGYIDARDIQVVKDAVL